MTMLARLLPTLVARNPGATILRRPSGAPRADNDNMAFDEAAATAAYLKRCRNSFGDYRPADAKAWWLP